MIWLGIKDAINLIIHYPRFLYGIWRLSRLHKPIITIFGGKSVMHKDIHYVQARELAQHIIDAGGSVVSGGGPGIMEAALAPACKHEDCMHHGLGIGVKGLDETYLKTVGNIVFLVGDFNNRKRLLMRYSQGLVFFPGGYGTLDELAEVANLIKVCALRRVPIALFGKDFWQPLFDWLQANSIKQGFVPERFAHILTVVDTVEDALKVLNIKKG